MKIIFWLLLFFPITLYTQDKAINYADWDNELLNEFILKEVNTLRKKAKVEPLVNEVLLRPAADDHTSSLLEKSILTHYQKIKEKKHLKTESIIMEVNLKR